MTASAEIRTAFGVNVSSSGPGPAPIGHSIERPRGYPVSNRETFSGAARLPVLEEPTQ